MAGQSVAARVQQLTIQREDQDVPDMLSEFLVLCSCTAPRLTHLGIQTAPGGTVTWLSSPQMVGIGMLSQLRRLTLYGVQLPIAGPQSVSPLAGLVSLEVSDALNCSRLLHHLHHPACVAGSERRLVLQGFTFQDVSFASMSPAQADGLWEALAALRRLTVIRVCSSQGQAPWQFFAGVSSLRGIR